MTTEYVKKFEEAVHNFEEQANKLKQISEVLQAVSALVTEVENSKNEIIETNKETNEALRKEAETFVGIRDHVDTVIAEELQQEREAMAGAKAQISAISEKIGGEVVKLTAFTEQETEARANLIANLTNVLINNGKEATKEVYAPLESIRLSLEADNKRLAELIDAEEKNAEKYVNEVKMALVKNNSDNIDVMKGFGQNVGYKLEALESSVKSVLSDTQKAVTTEIEAMRGKVAEDFKVMTKDERDAREKLQNSIEGIANKVLLALGVSGIVVVLLIYAIFLK